MEKDITNFLKALQEVTQWCHRYRPCCNGCPLAVKEMGGYNICAVTGYHGNLLQINLRETGKLLSKYERRE